MDLGHTMHPLLRDSRDMERYRAAAWCGIPCEMMVSYLVYHFVLGAFDDDAERARRHVTIVSAKRKHEALNHRAR